MFYFCLRIRPEAGTPLARKFGASIANVFVNSLDGESAAQKAASHLYHKGWIVEEAVEAGPLTAVQPPASPEQSKLLALANRHGIGCLIQAVPKEAENPDPLS